MLESIAQHPYIALAVGTYILFLIGLAGSVAKDVTVSAYASRMAMTQELLKNVVGAIRRTMERDEEKK